MRRLFSTFARGWPGAGLLFMRLVAGMALIDQGVMRLRGAPPIEPAIVLVLAICLGILLLTGLWTPIAGVAGGGHGAVGQLLAAGRSVDPYPAGNPGCRLGPARTWRLVGGCSPFWLEAHRHSR